MEGEVRCTLSQVQAYLDVTEVVDRLARIIELSAKTSSSQQSVIASLVESLQTTQNSNSCSCFIGGSFYSGTSGEKVLLDLAPDMSFKCPLCMYKTEKKKSLSKHISKVHYRK